MHFNIAVRSLKMALFCKRRGFVIYAPMLACRYYKPWIGFERYSSCCYHCRHCFVKAE